MKVLVSWLQDLVEIPDGVSVEALAHALHMAGFELASIEPVPATDRSGQLLDHAPSDAVLDFEITANRPDCLSVAGIAREVSALYDVPLMDVGATQLPLTPRPPLPLGRGGEGEKNRAEASTQGDGSIETERSTQGDGSIETERSTKGDGSIEAEGSTKSATSVKTGAAQAALAAAPHASEASGLTVTIEDPALCPRYAAAVADITVGPSPAWLAARLTAAGVRSINNIVDITNYVLLETGHPLHAFDLARLGGAHLKIRRARPGERVTTLDGQDRALTEDMLVIADAARPQAVAGVMGGADAEVSAGTRTIALESAYFAPISVRRTSKRLGLSTEASYRFERGADPEAPPRALARACALIEAIGAGTVRRDWIDARVSVPPPTVVTLRHEQVLRHLGYVVPPDVCARILARLGFGLSAAAPSPSTTANPRAQVWDVTVPSWRVDVSREIDLVEEIARQHGYDQIPTTFPALATMPPNPEGRLERDRLVRQVMRSAGFSEAATLAFIERPAALSFAEEPTLVAITNPLSEKFAVLRPSLLPGLVESLAHNRRREQRDVRLFEVATSFTRADGERRRVAGAWTGQASPLHWSGTGRTVDLFDITGVVSALCGALGLEASFAPASRSYLSPVTAAAVRVRPRTPGANASQANGHGSNGHGSISPGSSGEAANGPASNEDEAREIGVLGQLVPAIADARDIPANEPVFLFELDVDAVMDWTSLGDRVKVTPLPRHPSVVRDLSILVNADLPAEQVRATIRAVAPPTLERVVEFDRYQGKGVADGQCSLSLRLTFRAADRTLTDADIQDAMEGIVAALGATHGAVLR